MIEEDTKTKGAGDFPLEASRLELIAQASQVLVGEKPLCETSRELAEQVTKAMEVDACILRRLEGDELVLLGQHGVPENRLSPRVSSRFGLAREMIEKRGPIAVFDVNRHLATAQLAAEAQKNPTEFQFHSFAGVPLLINGRVIGLLGVYQTQTPRQFTNLDLDHLRIIGNQVAVALENDRLFREIREKNLQLLREVEQREQAEQRLLHHAFHDGLTGVPNRALFLEHVAHSIEHARGGLSFCILLLDLDRFKLVNESLGHQTGDKLLISVTGALRQMLKPGDILARLGGDEFGILLEDINQRTDARLLINNVHRLLSRPFRIDGRDVYTSACFGIVSYDSHHTGADEMLRDAEVAMYQAKSLGTAKHCSFTPEMRRSTQRLFDIETELTKALERQEIFLEFQPVIELSTGNVAGFEALARWKHSEYGLIPPSEFITVAEQTDRILELGDYLLSAACGQAVAWKALLPSRASYYVAVNVSPRQLAQSNLPQSVARALESSGLEPSCLCIELTETTILSRPADTIEQLERLRELGVKIFIDDFGTGYSSLSYLDCLPIDLVKIDRSFIAQINPQNQKKKLAPAIINLAHNLGYPVIAEGVETSDQLNYLKQYSVDYAQGFLISQSITAREVQAICRQMALLRPHTPR